MKLHESGEFYLIQLSHLINFAGSTRKADLLQTMILLAGAQEQNIWACITCGANFIVDLNTAKQK